MVPSYSHTAAITGTVILAALFAVVLTALAVRWWRRR